MRDEGTLWIQIDVDGSPMMNSISTAKSTAWTLSFMMIRSYEDRSLDLKTNGSSPAAGLTRTLLE